MRLQWSGLFRELLNFEGSVVACVDALVHQCYPTRVLHHEQASVDEILGQTQLTPQICSTIPTGSCCNSNILQLVAETSECSLDQGRDKTSHPRFRRAFRWTLVIFTVTWSEERRWDPGG